jgi:hypothetical protein
MPNTSGIKHLSNYRKTSLSEMLSSYGKKMLQEVLNEGQKYFAMLELLIAFVYSSYFRAIYHIPPPLHIFILLSHRPRLYIVGYVDDSK